MSNKLYIVATPIGNLGDITYRAVDTLKNVDFIAAEDTRVTVKLLNHFNIQKPLISYFEHNRAKKGEQIAERILAGEDCALVSDAGTPVISDPGDDLVSICRSHGIEVVPIPGASAVITALSACGISNGRFTFEGFLSTSKKNRQAHLTSLVRESRTMVFYEAPHKLKATLADLYSTLGDRKVVLCRELTKIHEQFLSVDLSEAIEYYNENQPRGEFVVVISGISEQELLKDELSQDEKINLAIVDVLSAENDGKRLKDAVRDIALMYDIAKNKLYNAVLSYKKENDFDE